MMRLFTILLPRATFLLFILTLLSFQKSFGQNYALTASSGTFTPIASPTAIDDIETDDNISVALPIGFSFNYFGTAYTQFVASSNGFISMSTSLSSSKSSNFISSNSDLIIAPLWDDLSGISGAASYALTGSGPNRVLTVEWLNYRWDYFATSAVISFQVKLYETSNKIEFCYRQEAGTPTTPAASIGLTSGTAGKFYSLTDAGTNPGFDSNGNDDIAQRPATGQVYAFTTGTAAVAPTTQASNINITANTTGKSATFSWSNGNGNYRAVFMKQTSSTSDLPTIANATFYHASSTFGTELVSSGWYCVYNGNGTSATVTGLESGLPYRVVIREYNGLAGGQVYNTNAATNNPINFSTALVTPGSPISTLTLKRISNTEASFDLSKGQGTNCAVFIRASSSLTAAPAIDNTTYTANTAFGSGAQIGTTGWYCVLNGNTGSSVKLTGLQGNTTYTMSVVDYNGLPGSERYNVAGSGNPVQFTTFATFPVMNYTFAASSGTFTPITGATQVDNLEDDDRISSHIPIGFTFRLSGVPFTELSATSNGYISFNPYFQNNSSYATNDLLSFLGRPVIAPLWDDLDGTGGQASYVTTGSAPNRIFTIEFLNWRWDWSATAASISYQIKLYEANNKIEFVYRQETGTPTGSNTASVGLAFPNTGSGNIISLNNTTAAPTASTTVETSAIAARPATGQIYSFTPQKLSQTITFSTLPSKFFGDPSFSLSATSSSGLPITYASSNTSIATVSGNTVTIVGLGSVTITASQAGDVNYNAATNVPQSFIVNKGNQTISFTPPGTKKYGSAAFNPGATASSGLAVTYASSNTAVATVSGSNITITGIGTADITASQSGNANYNAATDVVGTLTVIKGDQVVTFPTFPAKTFGDAPFTLSATADTGLPITYTSSNTSVATVSGNTVTIVGAGNTTLTATQAGNALYNVASDAKNLLVNKANPKITFQPIPTKTMGDAPFTLTATSDSGLPVYFTTNLPIPSVSISGNQVTILAPASVTIVAHSDGNANYFDAQTVGQTFCINPAKPVLTVTGLDTEIPLIHGPEGSSTYLWFKDGASVANDNGPSSNIFLVRQAGLYTLVTRIYDCSSAPSNGIAIVITDVEQSASDNVQVFPNPVEHELIVDVTGLGFVKPVNLKIHDSSGKVMYASQAQGKVSISVRAFPSGVYFLKAENGSRSVIKKIVKK